MVLIGHELTGRLHFVCVNCNWIAVTVVLVVTLYSSLFQLISVADKTFNVHKMYICGILTLGGVVYWIETDKTLRFSNL